MKIKSYLFITCVLFRKTKESLDQQKLELNLRWQNRKLDFGKKLEENKVKSEIVIEKYNGNVLQLPSWQKLSLVAKQMHKIIWISRMWWGKINILKEKIIVLYWKGSTMRLLYMFHQECSLYHAFSQNHQNFSDC